MSRWSVLNVDDNAPGRYARTKTLEQHGFSVHEAGTGSEALKMAAALLPDAVLLDVNLPDIDGFTVCASLKAGRETAHIPVVQISASMIEPRHQAHALERGSDAFLAEPVHPTVLVSTIRAAILAGKAEEEARKKARILDALMEYVPEGIAIAEPPDVTVRMLSRRGAEMSDSTGAASELDGASAEIWRLYHADGVTPARDEEIPITRATLHGELVTNEEWVVRRRDGQVIPCLFDAGPVRDPDGRLIGGIVVFRDIRQRKRMEEDLRRSHARIEQILSSIAGGYIELDGDWRIATINSLAAEAVGGTSESLIGQVIWEALPHLEGSVFDRSCREAKETQNPVHFEAELPVDRWYEVYAYPAGEGLSVYLREITLRKRSEEQLRGAQKLESLGMLAGGIAHDFNNLLSGIMGNASLALSELPEDHSVRDMLEDVVKSSQRAADLTGQLLAYAGKGRFYLQTVDVTNSIHKVSTRVTGLIGDNIELINACAESLPRVTADAHQLEQVLASLLMNATEAIGDSYGQITITSRLVRIDEEFARTEVNGEILPGRYIVIEISDTGPGISPEVLPQIFDPFFTTKFMGRGLGLAAARGIIRGHHGAISVRSSLGFGTTFWVYLPAAEKSEPRSFRKASAPLRARGKTILVVDDEQIVLSVCRSALEMNGFEVLAAHSGSEAVDILKRRAADVSAVILDVTMPQLSGEDTLPLLLNIREDLPVIVSSGYTRAQAMRAFSGHPNVAGFLQKPYTPAMLLQIVQPLFDQGALP